MMDALTAAQAVIDSDERLIAAYKAQIEIQKLMIDLLKEQVALYKAERALSRPE